MNSTKLLIILCMVVIGWMNLEKVQPPNANHYTLPPSNAIQYFTFGYRETAGDSFWLAAIQNFTKCEQDRGGNSTSASGAKMGLDRTPSCQRSWLYYMLDLILDLIPRFKYAARVGPVVLSVVVDDIEGATLLFDKALHYYPDDWVILSRAAYHYTIELEDHERGGLLYYRAAQLGAPRWMAVYASKLVANEGRALLAKRMLLNFMKSNDLNNREKKLFLKKLKALEK